MSYERKRITVGKDESASQRAFAVNPKLQRTQATGNRQGKVIAKESKNVVIDKIVRLPNRAVPLNTDQPKQRRAGRQPR